MLSVSVTCRSGQLEILADKQTAGINDLIHKSMKKYIYFDNNKAYLPIFVFMCAFLHLFIHF